MTPAQRRLALAIGAGAAVLVWLAGVAVPQIRALAVQRPQVRQLQHDLRQVRQDAAQLPQWTQRYEVLRAQLQAVPRPLAQERLPALLDQLAVMAKAAGVTVEVVRPVPPKALKKGAVRGAAEPSMADSLVIPIEILGRAGYHDVGRFVERLEAAQPLSRVETLTVEADRRDPAHHHLAMVVNVYLAVTSL